METLKKDIKGLSRSEVAERVEKGLNNIDAAPKQKSVPEIIKENTLTVFNLLNFVLGALVLSVGAYQNGLFLFVVFINLFIGIFNQVRAKRMLEKLSLTSRVNARVIREGKEEVIPFEDVVLDDIIMLGEGDAIPSDAQVISGTCETEESLLSGEVDAIYKKEGDVLYSGTYLVSGSCIAKVIHTGKDNYASKINEEAHKVKEEKSEIISALDKVIKTLTVFIVIFGVLLFAKTFFLLKVGYRDSLLSTTAAVIGMIPEGLILLTNVSLALGTMRLAKKNVLVQQMYAIETLARVDLLCIDKTGTITDGNMEVKDIRYLCDEGKEDLQKLLYIADDSNKTALAMKKVIERPDRISFEDRIAFSSKRKWSGAVLSDRHLILGAPEILLSDRREEYVSLFDEIRGYQENGDRVLILIRGRKLLEKKDGQYEYSPSDLQVEAVVRIAEHIREDARQIFDRFRQHGIRIKVISGDSAETVYHIARNAGAQINDNYIDVNGLSDDELRAVLDSNSVIGRVNPYQKRVIVEYFKEKGFTVAMTGDGVNDVPALRAADCGITLRSGSEAARTIAQIVLMDSNLSSIYNTILEGNIVINNIQRYATLFLVKTVFSYILSFVFLFLPYKYPFLPVQLTLVSTLCIGTPSFLLTFDRKYGRIEKDFVRYVASRALVGGATIALFVILEAVLGHITGLADEEISTISTIAAAIVGFYVLFLNLKPVTTLKILMFAGLLTAFVIALFFFRTIFGFVPMGSRIAISVIIYICTLIPTYWGLNRLLTRKEKAS